VVEAMVEGMAVVTHPLVALLFMLVIIIVELFDWASVKVKAKDTKTRTKRVFTDRLQFSIL